MCEKTSAASHTPGPWTYNGKSRAIYAWGAVGTSVANCTPDAVGFSSDANCRLIAAAPELLDELRRMVDMFERHIDGLPGPDDAADRWDCARAAIAKAEGGADA